MAKMLKLLMWVIFPVLSLCLSSCGKDDSNEPDNPYLQPTVSDEILVNSYQNLTFYKDDKYSYTFGVSGNGVILIPSVKNSEGVYQVDSDNGKSSNDGKWLCGMKKFESQSANFESFGTKLTNYNDSPATYIAAPNRGDIYALYLQTAGGNYIHYKILVKELAFNRKGNGLIESVKYLKVVYMSY